MKKSGEQPVTPYKQSLLETSTMSTPRIESFPLSATSPADTNVGSPVPVHVSTALFVLLLAHAEGYTELFFALFLKIPNRSKVF